MQLAPLLFNPNSTRNAVLANISRLFHPFPALTKFNLYPLSLTLRSPTCRSVAPKEGEAGMEAPATEKKSTRAKRLEIIMAVFAVLGVVGLAAMGAKQILDNVNIVNVPVEGEWAAADKAWLIDFRPDKTFVIASGPSRKVDPAASGRSGASEPQAEDRAWSDAWSAGEASYRVDARGTVWVKLKNGRTYTATLAPAYPNQMDLIDSDTGAVAVFERVARVKATQPLPTRASPPPQ